ncbi:hypothetical protein EV424DRAFT_1347415 [Suillus variegatus]|nr:hypothetical protein EV424DRAFT_1347415 [Suillus variegatus]
MIQLMELWMKGEPNVELACKKTLCASRFHLSTTADIFITTSMSPQDSLKRPTWYRVTCSSARTLKGQKIRKGSKHVSPLRHVTYYSDLSPYNTREWTCIISRMIRASGPWAHDKNILDYDGWAGREIIPDGGGWAHAGNI